MSNPQAFIPQSVEHFALKIITRLHLDKASTIGFIAGVLREAVYEERRTVHLREAVGCFSCRSLILRHQGLNEAYCTRCPTCREPMITQEELYRKKFHLLEEQLRQIALAEAFEGTAPQAPPPPAATSRGRGADVYRRLRKRTSRSAETPPLLVPRAPAE